MRHPQQCIISQYRLVFWAPQTYFGGQLTKKKKKKIISTQSPSASRAFARFFVSRGRRIRPCATYHPTTSASNFGYRSALPDHPLRANRRRRCRSPRNSAVRYVPNFDDAIFGTTGDDIIVMGAPGNIQYGTFVTSDQCMICRNSPRLQHNRNYVGYNFMSTLINAKIIAIEHKN